MAEENRLRVLVVDDLADAADSLALLLKLWGYDAEVFYDGAKVLEAARAYRPHVILLDIALPRMDGFEVARRLRECPEAQDALIVGITGYGGEACRMRAREAGFDHYLMKPSDPDQLHELLTQVANQQGIPRASNTAVRLAVTTPERSRETSPLELADKSPTNPKRKRGQFNPHLRFGLVWPEGSSVFSVSS